MEAWSIGVLIAGVGVAAAAVAAVPAILQLKRTLRSAERLLDDLDKSVNSLIYDEVKPLMKSLNGTIEEAEGVVRAARGSVEKLDETVEAVRGLGSTVRTITDIIDKQVKGTLINIVAYAVGIRTGLGVYLKSFKKQEVA